MRRSLKLLAAAALLLPGLSSAQNAQRVEVQLSSFKFTPATIRLQHGQPYLLHFANTSDGGHNFVAKEFFAAAQLSAQDRARVPGGKIELGGGESADIRIVAPAAGKYEAHCSHFMHSSFGMTGEIVVE